MTVIRSNNNNQSRCSGGTLAVPARLSDGGPVRVSLPAPDPEVSATPRRRAFTIEYKRRIVAEAELCRVSGQIGALLRREGLYSSHLVEWRRQLASPPRRRGRKPMDPALAAQIEISRKLQKEKARQRVHSLDDDLQQDSIRDLVLHRLHCRGSIATREARAVLARDLLPDRVGRGQQLTGAQDVYCRHRSLPPAYGCVQRRTRRAGIRTRPRSPESPRSLAVARAPRAVPHTARPNTGCARGPRPGTRPRSCECPPDPSACWQSPSG